MSATERLANLEHRLRPFLTEKLSPEKATRLYSKGRKIFLSMLERESCDNNGPLEELSRILWGLKFRSPIMNAAGMFKNGECYRLMHEQGAGAFMGGTTTWNRRNGYDKKGMKTPFAPYPNSGMSSNCLALPNEGDEEVSFLYKGEERIKHFPRGHSLMRSPDMETVEGMEKLVQGMEKYAKSGVDWLEINESCPNTDHKDKNEQALVDRLSYIEGCFIENNKLPVVVKFSNDVKVEQVPFLMDMLIAFGYAGVNFGNTSTSYEELRNSIIPDERKLYDFFCETFGGGVSGRALKDKSLLLTTAAMHYLREYPTEHEFHVFRTGGIENWDDIIASEMIGVSMNQWFTGYFEQFAKHGHRLYSKLYQGQELNM